MRKNLYFTILIMVLSMVFVAGAAAEITLGAGGAGTMLTDGSCNTFPDLRLLAGCEFFMLVSDTWSYSMEAGGLGFFKVTDPSYRYAYTAATAFLFRDNIWFFKTGVHASGEQLYYDALPVIPDIFDNRLNLEASIDIGDTTLGLMADANYSKKEVLGEMLLLEASIFGSFMLSEMSVMTARLSGGMNILDSGYSDYTLRPEVSVVFYPALPVSITVTGGVLMEQSDYQETLLSVSVFRNNRIQPFLSTDFGISIVEGMTFSLSLPAKLTFKDYNAIRSGAYTGEKEWVLVLSPVAELSIHHGDNAAWKFALQAEQPFTNSDYLDPGNVSFSALFIWTF